MLDPLSYLSFNPELHAWCNKDHGMYYPVCGMVNTEDLLLLIGNNSLYSIRFPFLLYEAI